VLGREYATLIGLYAADLRAVQEAFLTQRDDPPIAPNLPPIAGALYWCRSLAARVGEPIARVRALARDGGTVPTLREQTREALAAHATLAASLDAYEADKVAQWGAHVEASSAEKLRQPLLVRGGSGACGGARLAPSTAANGAAARSASSAAVVAAAAVGGDPRSLAVNFDPALVRLLREVKYFRFLGLPVPERAVAVFARAETYRRQTGHLDALAGMYNAMVGELLPVEAPLMKPHLRRVDAVLAAGLRCGNGGSGSGAADGLDWTSPHIDAFIAEAQGVVQGAFDTLAGLKGNLRDVVAELEGWCREPLWGSRKSKPMTPDEFEAAFKALRTARYAAIADGGRAIDRKLKEAARLLLKGNGGAGKAPVGGAGKPDATATAAATASSSASSLPHWAEYVDFVSGIVVQGLSRLAAVSLRRLLDALTPPSPDRVRAGGGELPLLAIDLVLNPAAPAGGVRFVPDVGAAAAVALEGAESSTPPPSSSSSSLEGIVCGWVSAFLHPAATLPRLDDPAGRYLKDVLDDVEVQWLTAQVSAALARATEACADFRASLEPYSFLWGTDARAAFAAFCESAYVDLPRTPEQAAAAKAEAAAAAAAGESATAAASADDGAAAAPPRVPDLAAFDAELSRLRDLADEIAGLRTPVDLGWLRVNCAPAKAALGGLVGGWVATYTAHLTAFVVDAATDTHAFLAATAAGLEEELETTAATATTAGPAPGGEPAAAAGASTAPQPTQAALKRVMGFIRGVRKTGGTRRVMLEPLRRATALLKKHGVPVDELTLTVPPPTDAHGAPRGEATVVPLVDALDGVELRLEAVTAAAFKRKEEIFPHQMAEVERIRRAGAAFEGTVRDFWGGFRKGAPFAFGGSPDEAYALLNGYRAQLDAVTAGAAELNTVEEVRCGSGGSEGGVGGKG
jgi:dynein heavy chain, axonemal